MKGKQTIFQHIVDKHVQKYNERYAEFGDDCKALGWPKEADNRKRFEVMLGVVRTNKAVPYRLLDFGCGLGHFRKWLADRDQYLIYSGLDINPDFTNVCYAKYPENIFYSLNILDDEDFAVLPDFDYIICNGVFTEKLDTSWVDQWEYFRAVIKRLWSKAKCGLAFNVMSPVSDWERDDLFYVSFDKMADFVRADLASKEFALRHDYGLWEYTTYVYR